MASSTASMSGTTADETPDPVVTSKTKEPKVPSAVETTEPEIPREFLSGEALVRAREAVHLG